MFPGFLDFPLEFGFSQLEFCSQIEVGSMELNQVDFGFVFFRLFNIVLYRVFSTVSVLKSYVRDLHKIWSWNQGTGDKRREPMLLAADMLEGQDNLRRELPFRLSVAVSAINRLWKASNIWERSMSVSASAPRPSTGSNSWELCIYVAASGLRSPTASNAWELCMSVVASAPRTSTASNSCELCMSVAASTARSFSASSPWELCTSVAALAPRSSSASGSSEGGLDGELSLCLAESSTLALETPEFSSSSSKVSCSS